MDVGYLNSKFLSDTRSNLGRLSRSIISEIISMNGLIKTLKKRFVEF